VEALTVVKHFDAIKDRQVGLGASLEVAAVDEFVFV
jgi:hypothetical protein